MRLQFCQLGNDRDGMRKDFLFVYNFQFDLSLYWYKIEVV